MAETALVVILPELEPLIGPWRYRYTGDGPRGMPPHVTLIFPFADTDEIGNRREGVARVLGAFAPFEITFRKTARFPKLLYLPPEPADGLIAMTEALADAFPEFPPYGGRFDEVVPHVTVAESEEDEVLAGIERELVTQLPVKARVRRAWLVEKEAVGWSRRVPFPLERHTSV